jgi:predicted dehydrogenase
MPDLKVGIIGFGAMGKLYAEALSRSKDAVVHAVADLDPKSQAAAVDMYHCKTYADYGQMLTAGGLDAVIITLPDFLHKDPVVKAAESGVHILVEKPFATTLQDADAMVAAVEKAKVKCMVEFFNRWSPPFTQAKKRVEAGELGEILHYSVELNDSIFVPTQMLKWSARSSPAWFLMSHTADLAFWITGKKPSAVQAQGVRKLLARRGIDTWDSIEAFLEYKDGSMGRLSNTWVLPEGMPMVYELGMRIVGEKAAIDIDTSDQEMHLVTAEKLVHPITAWGDILGYHVGHPYTMLHAFIDDIREGREPSPSHRDGYANTLFLLAVHESVLTGRKIELSL